MLNRMEDQVQDLRNDGQLSQEEVSSQVNGQDVQGKLPFTEPKLTFVEPKLVKRGNVTDVTAFIGVFSP